MTEADYLCDGCGQPVKCGRCFLLINDCGCERAQQPTCFAQCELRVLLTTMRVAVLRQLGDAKKWPQYVSEICEAIGHPDGAVSPVIKKFTAVGLARSWRESDEDAALAARRPRRYCELTHSGLALLRRLEDPEFVEKHVKERTTKHMIGNRGTTEWCAKFLTDHPHKPHSVGDIYDAAVLEGFTGSRAAINAGVSNLLGVNGGRYPTYPTMRFYRVRHGVYEGRPINPPLPRSTPIPGPVTEPIPVETRQAPPEHAPTVTSAPVPESAIKSRQFLEVEVISAKGESRLVRTNNGDLFTLVPFTFGG